MEVNKKIEERCVNAIEELIEYICSGDDEYERLKGKIADNASSKNVDEYFKRKAVLIEEYLRGVKEADEAIEEYQLIQKSTEEIKH